MNPMETPVPRPGFHLETLGGPPMPSLSCFPSFPRRRSHLDSNSYRTLVRILSHCIDGALLPPQRPLSSTDPNPRSDPKCLSFQNDSISDRNGNDSDAVADELAHGGDCGVKVSNDPSCPNPRFVGAPAGNFDSGGRWKGHPGDASAETCVESGHGDGLKEHDGREDGEIPNGRVCTDPELELVRHENFVQQSKTDECSDPEVPPEFLADFPGSTDGLADILSSFEELLYEEKSELQKDSDTINPESQDSLGSTLPKAPTAEISGSIISHDQMHGSSGELQGGEAREEERRECSYSEAAKESASEEITTEEGRVEESQPVKEMRGLEQDIDVSSNPVVCCSGSRNFDARQVSILTGLVNNGGIEEGEISGEEQVLEDQKLEEGSKEKNCKEEECNFPISDKKEGLGRTSTYDSFLKAQMKEVNSNGDKANTNSQEVVTDALGFFGENSKNLEIQKKEKPSKIKDVEGQVKKKQGPLTEARKAKKKSAKKRKRAQVAKEGGVKRLKLQPIVKAKVMKYCNFFMVGRCQQGDLCKFSHDTIPLTKSKPCKHFACNSCLKGEECPYDHELSKYPCHNYMSKGMCSRGDRCKFSHKMSVIEGFSTSELCKSDSPLSSEKQPNNNCAPLVANDCPKPTTSSSPFSMNKHVGANSVKCLKKPMQVPKGICFLSFGKGPSDGANKHDKLLLEKHGGTKICNQENQEKLLAVGYKNALNSEQKTLVTAQSESNMKFSGAMNAFTSKGLKNSSFSTGPVTPFSRSLQSEVSDATKILEEFLFGGGS